MTQSNKKKPMKNSFGVFDEIEILKEVLNAHPVLRDKVLNRMRNLQKELKISLIDEVSSKLAEREAKLRGQK